MTGANANALLRLHGGLPRRLSEQAMRDTFRNLFFAFIYNGVGMLLGAGVLHLLFGALLSVMIAYAELHHELERGDAPIGLNGILIAAHAHSLRLTVVIHEFPALLVLRWTTDWNTEQPTETTQPHTVRWLPDVGGPKAGLGERLADAACAPSLPTVRRLLSMWASS